MRATRRSQGGFTLPWLLGELEQMQPRPQAPLLLMSYLNPLLAFGLDRLPAAAARAGVAGFIIPDLPYEESAEMRAALDAQGLALVQMVTPVTPAERLQMLCAASQGFVYAVTMTGTTGRSVAVPGRRARLHGPGARRVAGAGVRGLRHPQRRAGARACRGTWTAWWSGSALVEVLERGEDPGGFHPFAPQALSRHRRERVGVRARVTFSVCVFCGSSFGDDPRFGVPRATRAARSPGAAGRWCTAAVASA